MGQFPLKNKCRILSITWRKWLFSSPSIKRAESKSFKTKQPYTNRAEELYLEAENVKLPNYIPPFTSCYETLYLQKELIQRAGAMEDSAKSIRHQFQANANSRFPFPTSTFLRKAVVLVKKGKLMFYTEQLSQVVQPSILQLITVRPNVSVAVYIFEHISVNLFRLNVAMVQSDTWACGRVLFQGRYKLLIIFIINHVIFVHYIFHLCFYFSHQQRKLYSKSSQRNRNSQRVFSHLLKLLSDG